MFLFINNLPITKLVNIYIAPKPNQPDHHFTSLTNEEINTEIVFEMLKPE